METTEKRKHSRVQVFNPISYSFKDSDNNALGENISVALNASQNGIQIETFTEVSSRNIRLRFIDIELNTHEIKGEVIYCEKQKSGIFKTGVRLMGADAENVYFVKQLVRFYHYNTEKSRPGVVQKERNVQTSDIDTIQL